MCITRVRLYGEGPLPHILWSNPPGPCSRTLSVTQSKRISALVTYRVIARTPSPSEPVILVPEVSRPEPSRTNEISKQNQNQYQPRCLLLYIREPWCSIRSSLNSDSDSTNLLPIFMNDQKFERTEANEKACKCLLGPDSKTLIVCIDGTSNQFGLKVRSFSLGARAFLCVVTFNLEYKHC